MGFNFKCVGVDFVEDLYIFLMEKQIIFIVCFFMLSLCICLVVVKLDFSLDDFKVVVRYYNGFGYVVYYYNESLVCWFCEFKLLWVV